MDRKICHHLAYAAAVLSLMLVGCGQHKHEWQYSVTKTLESPDVIRVTVAIERSAPNSDQFQVIHTPMLRFLTGEEASMTLMDDGHQIEVLIDQSKGKNRVRVVVDQRAIQPARIEG